MADKTKFDANREGTGTMEWAEVTENIQLGCANGCIYCFAAHNAARFGRRDRKDWTREELTKRAEMRSYPARDGVIMLPSSHDITPFNVEAFCRVAKLMLSKGNRLLIVSKPRECCIDLVCNELKDWRDQILFRFTIGSTSDATLAFWEPNAPRIQERINALTMAKECGYRTSVSAEPLLGGYETAKAVIEAVDQYVTDTIWIGKLNKASLRVWPQDVVTRNELNKIENDQRDWKIVRMVRGLDGPKIRWKDSIKQARMVFLGIKAR